MGTPGRFCTLLRAHSRSLLFYPVFPVVVVGVHSGLCLLLVQIHESLFYVTRHVRPSLRLPPFFVHHVK